MAVEHEIEVESQFAKSYVMNCPEMDEKYKKDLVNLIDITTMATNGISQEEKIQKITESIAKLAISQVGLVKSIKNTIVSTIKEENKDINKRIIDAITAANTKQCAGCKALSHANEVEEEKKKQEIIDEFINKSGLGAKKPEKPINKPITKETIYETIREILLKPYIWIFGSILVFSPYGFSIIKLLIDTFVAK